jgi:hypothetical protein
MNEFYLLAKLTVITKVTPIFLIFYSYIPEQQKDVWSAVKDYSLERLPTFRERVGF